MEKIANEQIKKMASIFKLKPSISEIFVNNRGEFQFTEDKQFSVKVTREQVEEEAEKIIEEPIPDNINSLPAGSQELAIELVEVKNQLTDEKKNHDDTAAKLEVVTKELEDIKAASGEMESLKVENDTLKSVAEAQETEIAKYKTIVEEYKAKVAELEKKVSKNK